MSTIKTPLRSNLLSSPLPSITVLLVAIGSAACVDMDEPPGEAEASIIVAQGQSIAKRTRGTNTQLPMPNNLLLADIDGDDRSELLQFADNELFWVRTDFDQSYVGHSLLPRSISRVLTGDFMNRGHHWVCAILDDDSLSCYGPRPDAEELWWAFTQPSFLSASEDVIVGDYDGNGRDDLLLYHRTSGAIRIFTIVGDAGFEPLPSFDLGALENVAVPGMKFRAGEFNGDARIDLLAVNTARQIFRFDSVYTLSKGGRKHSFSKTFTTGSFVEANEEVTIARVTNDRYDDIALHNTSTGTYRFFKAESSSGVLTSISSVFVGQLDRRANTLLFWGRLHSGLSEYGSSYRDDALVIETGNTAMRRYDARWSGRALTYWWAYTSYTPDLSTRRGLKLAYIARDVTSTAFTNEATSIALALADASYEIHLLGGATTMSDIRDDLEAANLGPSDRVVFVGEGHGGAPEGNGIYSTPADWAAHGIEVDDGSSDTTISADEIGDLADLVLDAGASIVILDASCTGGATVRLMEDRFTDETRVCAISPTGTVTPGRTNFPHFGSKLSRLNATATAQDLADWASEQLLDDAHGPAKNGNLRVHQLGYTNRCSHSMRLREGLALAYTNSSTWPRANRQRDVHVLLEPQRYADHLLSSDDAPEPNAGQAEAEWLDKTIGSFDDLTTARQEFHAAYASVAGEPEMRAEGIEYALALQHWHDAFMDLEDAFSSLTLNGLPLGKQLRDSLRRAHGYCRATSSNARLRRYQGLSCAHDFDGLIAAVLDDYPTLEPHYDNYQLRKAAAGREVIEASIALAPVEAILCEQAMSPCSRMLAR